LIHYIADLKTVQIHGVVKFCCLIAEQASLPGEKKRKRK